MALTFADTHNMITFLTKSDVSEGFDQIVNFLNAHVIQYALMVNPTIYVSCIKQFWTFVSIKKANDVVRLQALIDRKKVLITEDTIRQALRLDDADSVDCLPNEEIFVELARMGYEKPSTKLTFYKAFFSGVDTPLFDGMLVQQQAQDVDNATEDQNDDNETCATLTKKVANLEQDKIGQAIKITKLKKRVRRLEKKRQFKTSRLKRLRKVGTSQRVKSSAETVMDDQEDASKQGEITELDANEDVTLEVVDAEVAMNADVQGRLAESQEKVYHLDLEIDEA
nr:hypothetical protein [Tanacetum cinerariifolium]